jgi:uncharacterized membrane protein YgdD (TMEM256/DUF423 family)
MMRFLVPFAGLCLAAGAALAAQAAHSGNGGLETASRFLMIQGAALLGAASHAAGRISRLGLLGAALGTTLFCGDLVMRGFGYGRLFPMAAPAGGVMMIAGWAAFSIAALFRR